MVDFKFSAGIRMEWTPTTEGEMPTNEMCKELSDFLRDRIAESFPSLKNLKVRVTLAAMEGKPG